MIKALRVDMRTERAEAARMFLGLLGESQIADLGFFFLRDVYFGCLLGSGRYFCDVFISEGSVAGFITYTQDQAGLVHFMWKRRLFYVLIACAKGFFRDPVRLLRGLRKYLSFSLFGRSEPCSEICAEILSFAVSREHQKRCAVKISNILYKSALRGLNRAGAGLVKSITQDTNLMAKMLNLYFKMKPVYTGPIRSRGGGIYTVFSGETGFAGG